MFTIEGNFVIVIMLYGLGLCLIRIIQGYFFPSIVLKFELKQNSHGSKRKEEFSKLA
jgi:ABC-type phosphate transport system auxiliary subunit